MYYIVGGNGETPRNKTKKQKEKEMTIKEKLKNLVNGKDASKKVVSEKVATGIDLDLINAKTAEETKRLINAGADVNAKDWYGRTALMKACTAEQTKLLIDAGADVNAKDKGDYAPLISIEVGGRTALMEARTAEQTILLINAGADVNAKDDYGYTALMDAHTLEQTQMLINAGANVKAKNKYGKTALHFCCDRMFNKGCLLEMGLRMTPEDAYRETEERYPDTVGQMKVLVAAGADVNAKDEDGRVPLFYALYERKTAIEKMQFLINAGADVNTKSNNGKTLLMNATAEQMKVLINAGADVNAKDKEGETPLMKARTPEQMKVLIDAGADVNAKDKNGHGTLYHSGFGLYSTEKKKIIEETMAKVKPSVAQPSVLNTIKMKVKDFVKGRE